MTQTGYDSFGNLFNLSSSRLPESFLTGIYNYTELYLNID